MDKSRDCEESDGSISWEDFFGSSTDLLPTLLSMYDTLIAQQLSDEFENNVGPVNGEGSTPNNHNVAETVRWSAQPLKPGTIDNQNNSSVSTMATVNSNLSGSTAATKKSASTIVSSSCSQATGVNVPDKPRSIAIHTDLKTIVGSKNSVNQTQQQQNHRYGILSRSFSRWSSRITDKAANGKGSPTKGQPGKVTPQIQRPLSVNSTLSSASSSSSSSESSASLGLAPKASPEEEDIDTLPDADQSDDEADGRVKRGTNGEQVNGSEYATDRCFSNSTSKETTENGTRTRISYPISAQGRPKFYDPNLSYMDRVVMEIVETERVYVTDLREIISGYLDHWRSEAEDDKSLLLEDITELFSNIEEIHKFNSEFVTQLEGCGLDPVQVAKCFVTKNEGFSVYTQYCTHYPRTMSILTEMMRQDQSAKSFRERQAFLGHTLPLGSYLLKPVQRILKYHLLLQNIVKHYDGEEEGYAAIVEALSAMTNIAHHINDMKRRHEHAVRVQEIQSLLYGWQGEDLTTYGELCAEGTFRVYGAKALRHVFLFDKMLLITKKKEDGILSYKSHITCSNLMLIESVPGEPLSFHVIPFDNPRLQCTLQAKNLEQKRGWTLQLKRVILENYHAVIPTHARQLVMELGQGRPQDESVTSEKVQTKRQHSAPEYLERRKNEKDRRKAESTLKARLRKGRKNDPISPKESLTGRRNSRRTSLDSSPTTRDRSEDSCDREIGIGIDRKMSSASCPPSGNTEKRLVKKLSGWRRKSEPGISVNGSAQESNGLSSPAHGNSALTIDSTESIGEETCESEISGSHLDLCQEEEEDEPPPRVDPRRESVEEIVGQLVMQNREFQRILSKQRLVHLRRALAQHQQRQLHEEEESASETETEEQPPLNLNLRNGKHLDSSKCNGSQGSSSNGIGSMTENSRENIAEDDESILSLASKNVQRTVSDPGNKSTLTPRRFISGPFSHYDPLSLLWSSFRRSDPNRRKNGKTTEEKGKKSIRHTHSFTCSRKDPSPTTEPKESDSLPHGDSGVFPNSFTSDSSSSSEANIPTLPAVWLKQQGEHLATPSTKSGSLPRSFQVGQHQTAPPPQPTHQPEPGSPGVKSRLRDGKYPIPDRPFTIASDKPSPSDMTLDEMEQYMSKFNEEMGRSSSTAPTEDLDDLATELTPITSMENLSLHPDHKIYRSNKSSIKHILLSVTHRLSGIKANRMMTSDNSSSGTLNFGSNPNVNDRADKRGKAPFSSLMSRQQKKSLKQKIKEDSRDSDSENCESVTSSGFGSLGSCGSSTNNLASKKIGARLAQCCEHSDYALSKLLGSALNERLMNQRTQSVMSVSSTVTSSSSADGERLGFEESGQHSLDGLSPSLFLRPNRGGRKGINHRDLYLSYIDHEGENEDATLSDSDNSADSFYERSFEAIESLLESEMFPDSAIYSDQDEMSVSTSQSESPSGRNGPVARWRQSLCSEHAEEEDGGILSAKHLRLPSQVPNRSFSDSRKRSLVCSQAILEKLKHLEECAQFQKDDLSSPSFEGMKSIQERRRELELWRSGAGGREDESETSSQHSTSTINTVIEVSPSKTTSFPSSRRCSDTESSGGNSPLTERAASRSSGRSHSQGHLSSVSEPMPRGWVKLLVGKLQGEAAAATPDES